MGRKALTILCVFALTLSLLPGTFASQETTPAETEGEAAQVESVEGTAASESPSVETDVEPALQEPAASESPSEETEAEPTVQLAPEPVVVNLGYPILVGLAYGSDARPGANLASNVGEGYSFGYLDEERNLHVVAETAEKAVSVVKTQNVYYGVDESLSKTLRNYSDNISSDTVVGCWQILAGTDFADYETAARRAEELEGFVAWIDGVYQVRLGAYPSREAAEAGLVALPESVEEPTVVGTSAYGVSVVRTGTDQILFQFDGAREDAPLTVLPISGEGEKAITWYNNTRWYGGFQYRRVGGGNLTVINVVDMDDYITCLLSQEMSSSWPMEALKAQAVCARTYVETTRADGKHRKHGFDVCNTMDCQAYPGYGNHNERTDQATLETTGLRGWYEGKPAYMFYYSSSGGGSENVKNVWGSSYPYLCGVIDPYEETVKEKIAYWSVTKTLTRTQLDSAVRPYLQRRGYSCDEIVDMRIDELTPTGNVKSIVFTDKNGKEWPFTQTNATAIARSVIGLLSIRYSLEKSVPAGTGVYYTDGGGTLSTVSGVYAISGNGSVRELAGEVYVLSASGTEPLPAPAQPSGNEVTFTFHTSGWGHSVGMSQWGAYAMALQGKTFDEILKFYYPGIEIY